MVWNLIFSLLLNVGEIKTLNCKIWKACSSNQKENNLRLLIEFWVPIILCFCDFVGLLYFSDLRQREKGRNLTLHSICKSLRHLLCVILFFSNLIAFWWGMCIIWSIINILCEEKLSWTFCQRRKYDLHPLQSLWHLLFVILFFPSSDRRRCFLPGAISGTSRDKFTHSFCLLSVQRVNNCRNVLLKWSVTNSKRAISYFGRNNHLKWP